MSKIQCVCTRSGIVFIFNQSYISCVGHVPINEYDDFRQSRLDYKGQLEMACQKLFIDRQDLLTYMYFLKFRNE